MMCFRQTSRSKNRSRLEEVEPPAALCPPSEAGRAKTWRMLWQHVTGRLQRGLVRGASLHWTTHTRVRPPQRACIMTFQQLTLASKPIHSEWCLESATRRLLLLLGYFFLMTRADSPRSACWQCCSPPFLSPLSFHACCCCCSRQPLSASGRATMEPMMEMKGDKNREEEEVNVRKRQRERDGVLHSLPQYQDIDDRAVPIPPLHFQYDTHITALNIG